MTRSKPSACGACDRWWRSSAPGAGPPTSSAMRRACDGNVDRAGCPPGPMSTVLAQVCRALYAHTNLDFTTEGAEIAELNWVRSDPLATGLPPEMRSSPSGICVPPASGTQFQRAQPLHFHVNIAGFRRRRVAARGRHVRMSCLLLSTRRLVSYWRRDQSPLVFGPGLSNQLRSLSCSRTSPRGPRDRHAAICAVS